ncbi:MAG: hypothetical protein KF758_18265 [Anaerolineales bacterium]|nr:hypothetical protein [Anaerolineales bacterium]MBX3038861.1 hypothetical protein [Anaerolineales bacterium]
MNYKNVFSQTIQLFRHSKIIWILGSLAVVAEFSYRVSTSLIGKSATCYPFVLPLIAVYFLLLTKVGLIYSSNRIISNQAPTLSETWEFSKTKLKGILWLYFLSIPLVMFSVFIPTLVRLSEISDILTLLVELFANLFLSSLFTLSICAITINNLESGRALWTSLLIMSDNFFPIIALNIIFLVLQMLIFWVTGNSIICLIVFVPFTVTMSLAYRQFITKNSYPTLSNSQTTA